jgi:hypothetical protein
MDSVPWAIRKNQDFIDYVSACDPPCRVYFKQHPHSRARHHLRLKTRRRYDKILAHRHGSVYQLLQTKTCKAVIARNSNCLNDALLYDVPAIALGRGIWPGGHKVFGDVMSLRYVEGFMTDWRHGSWPDRRKAYIYALDRPVRVGEAIEGAVK